MIDRITIIIALLLGLALIAAMITHTRADDRARARLAECRSALAVEGEVADACMAVVEQCRALVEGHACSCWRPE